MGASTGQGPAFDRGRRVTPDRPQRARQCAESGSNGTRQRRLFGGCATPTEVSGNPATGPDNESLIRRTPRPIVHSLWLAGESNALGNRGRLHLWVEAPPTEPRDDTERRSRRDPPANDPGRARRVRSHPLGRARAPSGEHATGARRLLADATEAYRGPRRLTGDGAVPPCGATPGITVVDSRAP